MVFIKNLRIGQKVVLALLAAILVAFIVTGVVVSRLAARFVDESAMSSVKVINGIVTGIVGELEGTCDRLSESFAFAFHDKFHLEDRQMRVGEFDVPVLSHAGKPLAFDYGVVDRFAEATKAVATIFVRSGNDFVRITTNAKKEDGELS